MLKRIFLKFIAPVLTLMLALEGLRYVMENPVPGSNPMGLGLIIFGVLVLAYFVFKGLKRNLL